MCDELENIIRELNPSCRIGEYRDRIIGLFENEGGEKVQVENIVSLPDILFALESARETICFWHSAEAWEIYDNQSPEMKLINKQIVILQKSLNKKRSG